MQLLRDRSPETHADEVLRLFESKAGTWQAKYVGDGPLKARLARFSEALARILPPPARVMDFGCGTGDLAMRLTATGYKVVGCDFSGAMVTRAVSACQDDETEWVQLESDWAELPFSSAAFDAIVASSVLEYLASPDRVLGECARVLRPSGVFLCTVPNSEHPVRWLEAAAAVALRAPLVRRAVCYAGKTREYVKYIETSKNRFDVDTWRTLFEMRGFQMIDSELGVERGTLRMMAFRRRA